MWKIKDVEKERKYFIGEKLKDITVSEAMKEIDRMDEYYTDDLTFREYIFKLNLDDKDAAFLLNYGAVCKPGIVALIGSILMFIIFWYNTPMNIYVLLMEGFTSFKLRVPNAKRSTTSDKVILQLLNAVVSTFIYSFLILIFYKGR